MSIITAIIQAILQAVTYILPISESGHSSLFHDFANRFSGNCSAITGIIHIGIAVGILVALYKLFLKLAKEFFCTFKDVFTKKIKGNPPTAGRKFMYMTLIAFAPMILWLIPTGNGFLFTVFNKTSYNQTLFDDGIFFIILAAFVFIADRQLQLAKNDKTITWWMALAVGVANVLFASISGLSSLFCVFAMLLLLGVNKKDSLRFAFVLSVPMLIVKGIIEICISVTPANVVAIILGLIISAVVSFFMVNVFKLIIKKHYLKYFCFYDAALGVISLVVGFIEFFVR